MKREKILSKGIGTSRDNIFVPLFFHLPSFISSVQMKKASWLPRKDRYRWIPYSWKQGKEEEDAIERSDRKRRRKSIRENSFPEHHSLLLLLSCLRFVVSFQVWTLCLLPRFCFLKPHLHSTKSPPHILIFYVTAMLSGSIRTLP